jgi:hypothetical protein
MANEEKIHQAIDPLTDLIFQKNQLFLSNWTFLRGKDLKGQKILTSAPMRVPKSPEEQPAL